MTNKDKDTRANKADQENQKQEEQSVQQSEQAGQPQSQAQQGQQRDSGEGPNGQERPLWPEAIFDAGAATRVALLRLARNWRAAGSTYQALRAYERVLIQYQGTGAANAAAEELITMADELEKEGRFYTALNILTKLEQLA